MKEFWHQFLVWLTHTLNFWTGGKSSEDFSSRCYRRQEHWKALKACRKLIDLIFGEDHCYQSYLKEKEPKAAWERH